MKNIYSLIQKTIEFKLLFNNSSGRVLVFHKVVDNQSEKHKEFSITYDIFKSLIESLLNEKQKFISLNDLVTVNQLSSNSIALTFDDGYACVYEFIAQYLFGKSIPFAIFTTIDFLNKPMYVTSEQLIKLSQNNLCTIGAHSISHPLLRKLNDLNSKYEIKNSKIVLEEILAKNVEYFAYPYGSVYAVSKRDINFAKEAGYKLAFSTINGCLSKKSLKEKWFLPRINVSELNYYKIIRK